MIIQMKAIKQYFPVVLFIMLCHAVLTFQSVDEILQYGHLNENLSTTPSYGIVKKFGILFKFFNLS